MRYIVVALVVTSFLVVGCGDVKVPTNPSQVFIEQSNKQLKKVPLEGAFGYKSYKLNKTKWMAWADKAAPIVKKILDQMPEGYVLMIVGHASAVGPEEPQPDGRKGNIYWSTQRAKVVYDALVAKGLPKEKMAYKGVGSSELDDRYPPRDNRQIRVTFRIVPKEGAKKDEEL